MENKNTPLEEHLWLMSAIILAGICSNYSNQVPSSDDAKRAINLSLSLLSQLTSTPLSTLCANLYQREH